MIKRLLYIIINVVFIILNFVTLYPLLVLVMAWLCVVETPAWIVTGRTILKEPLDALNICFWGGPATFYFKRKLKLE